MIMLPPLLSVVLVLVILCVLLGVLTLFRRRYRPHPELPRKLLHIAMGSVMLSFPWVFDTVWVGLVLAGLGLGFLAALRLVPLLRGSLGAALIGWLRGPIGLSGTEVRLRLPMDVGNVTRDAATVGHHWSCGHRAG